jgi:hypothetical protein
MDFRLVTTIGYVPSEDPCLLDLLVKEWEMSGHERLAQKSE